MLIHSTNISGYQLSTKYTKIYKEMTTCFNAVNMIFSTGYKMQCKRIIKTCSRYFLFQYNNAYAEEDELNYMQGGGYKDKTEG